MGWLASRRVMLILSTLGLLLFLGRAFADVRWEYPLQDSTGASMPGVYAFYLIATAIWVWALLSAQEGSRAAVITMIVLNGLLLIVMAILTAVLFCPPGCIAFPLGWFWNWTGLGGGVLAVLSEVLHLRQKPS